MSQCPVSSQAKDWMDQLFLCPGLFWKRVSPMVVIGRGKSATFFCVLGHLRYGDKQLNDQQGDPRASLLLTNEKVLFCKIFDVA